MYSSPLDCFLELFGQKKRGDTIGRGTLKKLGRLSLGSAIWYISTTSTTTKKRNPFRVLSL